MILYFDVNVGLITLDGATVVIMIKDSAIARIEEVNTDDDDESSSTIHEKTTNSDGVTSVTVNPDSILHITAKKYGYDYAQITHDVSNGTIISLSLQHAVHVDSGQNISLYVEESGSGIENKIYFNYIENKSELIFGEINLRTKAEISKALFDHRITTFED